MLNINLDDATIKLTGRKGGLRPSKPQGSGLYAYMWRMASFHSGADMRMPMTCYFDLQNYLDAEGINVKVCGLLDDDSRALLDEIDTAVDIVLIRLGEDNMRAARRWGHALGL